MYWNFLLIVWVIIVYPFIGWYQFQVIKRGDGGVHPGHIASPSCRDKQHPHIHIHIYSMMQK